MIVSILTDPAVGGTFLTWSIYYLAGQEYYRNFKKQETVVIPDNPLTDINAHNFIPTQPNSVEQVETIYNNVKSAPEHQLDIIYMHNLPTFPYNNNLSDEITKFAVEKLKTITNKFIVLYTADSHKLYSTKYEGRTIKKSLNNPSIIHDNSEKLHNEYIDTFFLDSKEKWNELGLTQSWNYREFLALNLRPYNVKSILPAFNLTADHYRIEIFDLYQRFDITVKSLFNFLNLEMDLKRYNQWIPIYNQWKKLHHDRIEFVEYFDLIVDSIINNYSLDLTRFKLDIVREATIQHVLIFKHGLTLKSHELEKFPNNAQELHTLLEPNIYHNVEDIYGSLGLKN